MTETRSTTKIYSPIHTKYEDLSTEFKHKALKRVHAILSVGFSTNKIEIAKDLSIHESIAASLLNEFTAKGYLEKIVVVPNRTFKQNLRYIYRLKRPQEA